MSLTVNKNDALNAIKSKVPAWVFSAVDYIESLTEDENGDIVVAQYESVLENLVGNDPRVKAKKRAKFEESVKDSVKANYLASIREKLAAFPEALEVLEALEALDDTGGRRRK